MTSLDDPNPQSDEQDERLREHLERAHAASMEAMETIELIAEELRFPLAFSTRVKEVRRAHDTPD